MVEARFKSLTDNEKNEQGAQTLEVELRNDLVDSVIIGQEIVIVGVLKMRSLQDAPENSKCPQSTNAMRTYLKASSIVDGKYVPYVFSEDDMQAIQLVNRSNDSFKLLVASLAPEVHGHEMAKAACLLSLLGGAGSQIDDDRSINILLIGDPGVGKSRLLKMCGQLSQKSLKTN